MELIQLGAAKQNRKCIYCFCGRGLNHHVYLRYCPAGGLTNSCEPHVIFLSYFRSLFKYARDGVINEGLTKGVILCDKIVETFFYTIIHSFQSTEQPIRHQMWEERQRVNTLRCQQHLDKTLRHDNAVMHKEWSIKRCFSQCRVE